MFAITVGFSLLPELLNFVVFIARSYGYERKKRLAQQFMHMTKSDTYFENVTKVKTKEDLFAHDFSHQFPLVKVKKRRALVKFKYYPHFDVRKMKEKTKTFRGSIFYLVNMKFKKKNGEWVITYYDIEDLKFGGLSVHEMWVKARYQPLTQSEKHFRLKK